MSNEPLESIEGPDSDVAELRAEATGNPQADRAATTDDLAGIDTAPDPVVALVKKRARRVQSRPVSQAREQQARKRSRAARVSAALEQEPEFLTGLETGPASMEPPQASDGAAEPSANALANATNEQDWSPHAVPTNEAAGPPQNDHDAADLIRADDTATDPTPPDWNGSEPAVLNGSIPADTAPALAAAEFQDTTREQQPFDQAPALAEVAHIEDRFEHRGQHHEHARQPEPQVDMADAAAGAAMYGTRPAVEPIPLPETGRAEPASSESLAAKVRHSLKLQLALIALVPMLLGGATPGVIAYFSPAVFAARSEIVLNISSLDWSAAERFRATQLVVVKARSTLAPISESMKIPLRDLEKDIQVGMMGSSDVIGIQYANRDPATALAVVNAVTAQYLIDLREFEQIRNGRHRVLLPATILDDPVSLSPLRAAAIGVVVGFVIAMAGIVVRTQLRPVK